MGDPDAVGAVVADQRRRHIRAAVVDQRRVRGPDPPPDRVEVVADPLVIRLGRPAVSGAEHRVDRWDGDGDGDALEGGALDPRRPMLVGRGQRRRIPVLAGGADGVYKLMTVRSGTRSRMWHSNAATRSGAGTASSWMTRCQSAAGSWSSHAVRPFRQRCSRWMDAACRSHATGTGRR